MGVKTRELRHRITFQTLTLTPDGQGGSTESWANIPDTPTCWAKVTPKSAKERYFSQRVEMNTTHEIVVRWRNDLTSKMRIVHEGKIFQIHGIRAEDEERWWTYIDAEENVGT